MKNLIYACLAAGVLCTCSCSFDEDTPEAKNTSTETTGLTLKTDMTPSCWSNTFSLQRTVVHTPPFASRIDPEFPFSYGFSCPFKDIDAKIPHVVDVSFFMLLPETGIKSNLIFSVDSLTKNKFWLSIDLSDSVKNAREWQQLRATIALPTLLYPEDKLSIYVWSAEKKELFLDDLSVHFPDL